MTADLEPEAAENNFPLAAVSDGKGEQFCRPQNHKTAEDGVTSKSPPEERALWSSVDSGSVRGQKECDFATSSNSSVTQSHCSNGQKSKRTSSPGPHPVKTSCVDTHSPSPKLTLCLSNSPRKGIGTPSDVEMLSPDSPNCKSILTNHSDKDHGDRAAAAAGAADESFTESQGEFSQPLFVIDSNSGSLAKERTHMVSMGTNEAEGSASSDMSQDVISSQPGLRYAKYFHSLSNLHTPPFKNTTSAIYNNQLLCSIYTIYTASMPITAFLCVNIKG